MEGWDAVGPVFFSGALVQALLVSRSWRGAMGTLALAGACLGFALFSARDQSDPLLAAPFYAIFLFVLLVAAMNSDQLLPTISATTLLHYTFLAVYAMYVRSETTPEPGLVVAAGGVPILVAFVLGTSSKPPERFLQLVGYVCYLILLTVLIGGQVSLDALEVLLETEVYPFSLYVYVFVSGMVFLVFASNVLYLLVLIPIGRLRFFRSEREEADERLREHRDLLRSKMSGGRISALAALLLLAHVVALVANYRWQLVAADTWVNAVIVALAMLSTWTRDGDEHPTVRPSG